MCLKDQEKGPHTMNLEERVGQRLMVGIRGDSLDTDTKDLLQEIKPGSVILFRRNIKSAAQVRELIFSVKGLLPSPPLIAIDQEGGLVVRFIRDITVFPGNMALGATDSTDLAYRQGLISASELKNIGVDINLAPVVDVVTTYHNPGITIRSFGDNPHRVSELGIAYIRGTQEMKVAAVAKHFPGKGAAEVDAHLDLPVVAIPHRTFEQVHLLPFKKAIKNGVKGIMSTHIYCPSLDRRKKRPATFSPKIVNDYLREKLHFPGVIFSDDLEMGAIAKYYSIGEACIKSALSGHDFLLICSDRRKQREGFYTLVDAYRKSLLSLEELEVSAQRIQSLKSFCQLKPTETSPTFNSKESQSLAQHIADKSITLVADKKGLIPIKDWGKKRIVLIVPDLSTFDSLEDGYQPSEEHFFFKAFRTYFTGALKACFLPVEINPKDVERTASLVSKNDTVIALIFDAQANKGQRQLLFRLQEMDAEVILVLIRNPFDIEFLNPSNTCLITYGFRKSQMLSLLKVIFGKIEAKGGLPFRDTRTSYI